MELSKKVLFLDDDHHDKEPASVDWFQSAYSLLQRVTGVSADNILKSCSAEEALNIFQKQLPEFVVSDVNLGEGQKSGVQFLLNLSEYIQETKDIKDKQRNEVKVLCWSMAHSANDIAESLKNYEICTLVTQKYFINQDRTFISDNLKSRLIDLGINLKELCFKKGREIELLLNFYFNNPEILSEISIFKNKPLVFTEDQIFIFMEWYFEVGHLKLANREAVGETVVN